MSSRDAIFEPLLGKRRTVRQALVEVAERWATAPIDDVEGRAALEDAVRHKILRGEIGGELSRGVDAAALARAFIAGLVAGEGIAAVGRIFPGGLKAAQGAESPKGKSG